VGYREQVLAYVKTSAGECDDCVATRLSIEPRQKVNSARRALQAVGLLASGTAACTRCGRMKLVSHASGGTVEPASAPSRQILDGSRALDEVLRRAGYPSVLHAVAEHTVFLHPDTVTQTNGEPVLPVIRAPLNTPRRRIVETAEGRRLWADDNGPPTYAFLWAARRRKGPDVQFNHLWPGSDVPELYTALWNLCVTPAFLAKTTDTHPEVRSCLRYRSFGLYGYLPAGEPQPSAPAGYDTLSWAVSPEPVADLEAVYRVAMASAPKNSATLAARELGWLFSRWMPDATV
jgi:hypothetical protein